MMRLSAGPPNFAKAAEEGGGEAARNPWQRAGGAQGTLGTIIGCPKKGLAFFYPGAILENQGRVNVHSQHDRLFWGMARQHQRPNGQKAH
jgi:hypothetical protein